MEKGKAWTPPGGTVQVSDLRRASRAGTMAVCTVASKNYLAYLRVFSRSFRHHHPDIPIYVLLTDQIEGCFNPAEEPFEMIPLQALDNIPDPWTFFFKYSALELNTAVKPYFFETLFRRYGLQKLIFCDPDMVFYSSMDEAWQALEDHPLLLTPHITVPYGDTSYPGELEISRAGLFNLGFLGLSNSSKTMDFLGWWQHKLYDQCYMDPTQGLFVDQKWAGFAMVLVEGTQILRNPSYNMAYWNLHQTQHQMDFRGGRLFWQGKPAVSFHFSGFDPLKPGPISRHQNRFHLNDVPQLRPLFEDYAARLCEAGYAESSAWPYAFGYFENNVRIPQEARSLYRDLGPKAAVFGNPFRTGPGSFFEYLNESAEGRKPSKPGMTRLVQKIYASRNDVREAFPEAGERPGGGFFSWLRDAGAREHGLDGAFVEAAVGGYRPSWGERVRAFFKTRLTKKQIFIFLWTAKRDALQLVRDAADAAARRIQARRMECLPFGANLAGYFQGVFSTAEITRSSVEALKAAGIPHVLTNVSEARHNHGDRTLSHFQASNPYRFNLVFANADMATHFWRGRPVQFSAARTNIALWFWELPRFPARWSRSFDYYQEIWTPTTFCLESISRASAVPVLKMPTPVIMEKQPDQREAFGFSRGDFVFLFCFDFLSVLERKNPSALIRAFRLAFGDRPGIHLLIKTINSHHEPEKMRRLQDEARGGRIRLLDAHLAKAELSKLMNSCDAYAALHRSEGFGQAIAEAMLLEKPVIATGYSGNMEFMTRENSFPVRYALTPIPQDYDPYEKGQVWADPDEAHAAELMRQVHEDRGLAAQKAERAALEIRRAMSPEACGRAMKERLLELSRSSSPQKKRPIN
jgi:glycosyltransferase involved in cell wall biosynthesis